MAEQRIRGLFALAKKSLEPSSPFKGMGDRYIRIAERISAHYKVRIPNSMKAQICRSCHRLLVPGLNATVRVVSGKGYVAYTCRCGAERHIFYK